MLVAITSTCDTLDALVNEKFGRCQYFLIVDPYTMKFEAVPNPAEQAQGGAGPKAAEVIINKGVNVLLTGHVGDKAEQALKTGNIKVVDGLSGNVKVKDALNNYLSNLKRD
ncbi:MAG: NifB/NifX family molybdenum-iron cluster-binding protein [Ignavibacteriales bacterium]|nr:NifB/NifX family molybdenum-iron cluster-binding protein [Ignavibacteriales bacterium]